jgi:hypothetical protein
VRSTKRNTPCNAAEAPRFQHSVAENGYGVMPVQREFCSRFIVISLALAFDDENGTDCGTKGKSPAVVTFKTADL